MSCNPLKVELLLQGCFNSGSIAEHSYWLLISHLQSHESAQQLTESRSENWDLRPESRDSSRGTCQSRNLIWLSLTDSHLCICLHMLSLFRGSFCVVPPPPPALWWADSAISSAKAAAGVRACPVISLNVAAH